MRVLQNVDEPDIRMGWIQRHPGFTCFQNAEERGNHHGARFKQEWDRFLALPAWGQDGSRQPVGGAIQRIVSEGIVFGLDSNLVRVPVYLLLKPIRNRTPGVFSCESNKRIGGANMCYHGGDTFNSLAKAFNDSMVFSPKLIPSVNCFS